MVMAGTAEIIAADLTPHLTLLRAMRSHGHLSAAAEAAGVPQPTATRWIGDLSSTVGVALTRRVGRRSELTAAGVALADAVVTSHQSLAIGVARALEAADPARGHVVFGFLRSLGTTSVPALLRGFRSEYPHVRFSLLQAGHHELLERVAAGTVDVALSSTLAVPTDLHSVALYREPLVLVVQADHRLAKRRRVRLEECRHEPFVSLRPGVGFRSLVDSLFTAAGFSPAHGFEGDDVETVRGLVGVGLGVAVLPAREGGPLAGTAEPGLRPHRHREIGLITSNKRRLEPAAASFYRYSLESSF
ncbi:LysR family transcriptional regulator [Pseudonocardia yunnanensis]